MLVTIKTEIDGQIIDLKDKIEYQKNPKSPPITVNLFLVSNLKFVS